MKTLSSRLSALCCLAVISASCASHPKEAAASLKTGTSRAPGNAAHGKATPGAALDLIPPNSVAQNSRTLPPGWVFQPDPGLRYSAAYQSGPGSIYLESDSPGAMSLRYEGPVAPGRYRLEARVSMDGNGPKVSGSFNGSPLTKKGADLSGSVTASGGKAVFVLKIGGSGKVFGHLSQVRLVPEGASSSAHGKPSIEGSWASSSGDQLTFGPIGPEGSGKITGLGEAVEYQVNWDSKDARAFRLSFMYGDDPGIPPSYSGVLSADGSLLHLTMTPSKRLPGPLPAKTTIYRKRQGKD